MLYINYIVTTDGGLCWSPKDIFDIWLTILFWLVGGCICGLFVDNSYWVFPKKGHFVIKINIIYEE